MHNWQLIETTINMILFSCEDSCYFHNTPPLYPFIAAATTGEASVIIAQQSTRCGVWGSHNIMQLQRRKEVNHVHLNGILKFAWRGRWHESTDTTINSRTISRGRYIFETVNAGCIKLVQLQWTILLSNQPWFEDVLICKSSRTSFGLTVLILILIGVLNI